MTEAPWRLSLHTAAERAIARMSEKAATAVMEFVTGPLLENPQRVGHELRPPLSGTWSARVGPYRLLYRIHHQDRLVELVDIAHRADVYRRRQ